MATDDDSTAGRSTSHGDEDWKQRIKEEDAALDERLASEERPSAGSTGGASHEYAASSSGEAGEIPPANFSMLVTMFATQALVALGLIPNSAIGKGEPQIELARHFIDLLGVVEDKTRGNLNADEAKLVESSLHELRMAFVEISKQNPTGGTGDSSDT